jgi:hypothetical protein
MKQILARRGFLGALAALPTIAKAGAERAMISGPISTGYYDSPTAKLCGSNGDTASNILSSIREALDPQKKAARIAPYAIWDMQT